jgi:hypothetical protein
MVGTVMNLASAVNRRIRSLTLVATSVSDRVKTFIDSSIEAVGAGLSRDKIVAIIVAVISRDKPAPTLANVVALEFSHSLVSEWNGGI